MEEDFNNYSFFMKEINKKEEAKSTPSDEATDYNESNDSINAGILISKEEKVEDPIHETEQNIENDNINCIIYSHMTKSRGGSTANSSKIYMSEILKYSWKKKIKMFMVKMKKKYIKKEKEDKLNISIEAKIKNNINNINDCTKNFNNKHCSLIKIFNINKTNENNLNDFTKINKNNYSFPNNCIDYCNNYKYNPSYYKNNFNNNFCNDLNLLDNISLNKRHLLSNYSFSGSKSNLDSNNNNFNSNEIFLVPINY